MLITCVLTPDQSKMINNLIMTCNNKMEMFDYLLVKVGLNAFHSTLMSNSFSPEKYSYSIVPVYVTQQRKTYHCENGRIVLIEV